MATTLQMTLAQTDVMAALAAWISAQPGTHVMNLGVNPVLNPNGSVTVTLTQ